jgi:hypothetical protein
LMGCSACANSDRETPRDTERRVHLKTWVETSVESRLTWLQMRWWDRPESCGSIKDWAALKSGRNYGRKLSRGAVWTDGEFSKLSQAVVWSMAWWGVVVGVGMLKHPGRDFWVTNG